MTFVQEFEWWQIVLSAIFWWATLMGAYWYGGHVVSTRNRSRKRSQYKPILYDDLQPDPPLPPPRPDSRPELDPWVAYDDGSWERMCRAGCDHGMLPGNRLCSTCNASGYEVTYEDPYQRSPGDMETSTLPPPSTTSEVTQVTRVDPSRGRVTFQWPPADLVEHP